MKEKWKDYMGISRNSFGGKKKALFFGYRNSKKMYKNSLKELFFFVAKSEKESVFASFRGSLSLEASLVIPILCMFLMSILLSVEMVRLQTNVFEALHQGVSVAFEEGKDENIISVSKEYIEKKERPYVVLKNGENGIKFTNKSSIESDGIIDIQADYSMKTFVDWIPLGNLNVSDSIHAHSFVGYKGNRYVGERVTEDDYVYVTETGIKYHLSSECTYIKLHPIAVDYRMLKEIRNNSGGKYYPCERCRPGKKGTIYITDDGECYHCDPGCSSLKRTVNVIPLKEALKNGYTPCSKCG